MKFISGSPPPDVPGVCQQGGGLGPFSRSARTPVDPRTLAQYAARGAMHYGAKIYRFGDSTYRAAWRASAQNGTTGSQKSAGVQVRNSKTDVGPHPTPPLAPTTAAPSGTVAVLSVDGSVITFDSDAPALLGVVQVWGSSIGQRTNYPPQRLVFVGNVWDAGVHVTDFYLAWRAVLPLLSPGFYSKVRFISIVSNVASLPVDAVVQWL